MSIQLPVFHIPGMKDRYSRKPLKTGNSNIVIVSLSADAGICVKAGKNRVFQNHILNPPYTVIKV
jgi:hypothetical protein